MLSGHINDGFQHDGWQGHHPCPFHYCPLWYPRSTSSIARTIFPLVNSVENGIRMKDCKADIHLNEHFGEFIMQSQWILK